MNHIDLFNGIGGFALAAQWTWGEQYRNVAHSEIEKYPCKVYHRHFPESECLGDVTKINWQDFLKIKGIYRELGIIDLLTAGFPCQPHSVAGKRKGSEDERDLWGECIRALTGVRPKYAVFENVPGIITSEHGLTWARIKMDLEASGYEGVPLLLSASDVGAKHKRTRVWIVCRRMADTPQWKDDRRERRNLAEETTGRESIDSTIIVGSEDVAHPTRLQQGRKDERAERERIGLSGEQDGVVADTNRTRPQGFNASIEGLPEWSGGEMGQPWPVTEFERPDGEADEIVDDSKNNRKTDRGLDSSNNTGKGSGRAAKERETLSKFCGIFDGLPNTVYGSVPVTNRVERLKGLGNAIVPQCARVIFESIKRMENV